MLLVAGPNLRLELQNELLVLQYSTTSEIAISRVLRSVHCRLHTFFLDIDLARFDSEKLCVLSKI